MPSLTLLRHARSRWPDGDMPDHDRPLDERGQRDAPATAARLQRLVRATQVLCSPALRTRQTLQHLIDAGAVDPADVRIEPSLYLAPTERIDTLIGTACDAPRAPASGSPDHADDRPSDEHLLVIGHNPGLEELASRLAGRPLTLRTCSLCHYERAGGERAWRLVEHCTPRG